MSTSEQTVRQLRLQVMALEIVVRSLTRELERAGMDLGSPPVILLEVLDQIHLPAWGIPENTPRSDLEELNDQILSLWR